MRGDFGDVSYTVDDGYLILHTDAGDVMIGIEELEELSNVIKEILDND